MFKSVFQIVQKSFSRRRKAREKWLCLQTACNIATCKANRTSKKKIRFQYKRLLTWIIAKSKLQNISNLFCHVETLVLQKLHDLKTLNIRKVRNKPEEKTRFEPYTYYFILAHIIIIERLYFPKMFRCSQVISFFFPKTEYSVHIYIFHRHKHSQSIGCVEKTCQR